MASIVREQLVAPTLQSISADFKAIAGGIQIDLADAGKLLVAARLFDRARDLAEAGSEEAYRQAERLIFPERNADQR